jgi:hypothetical protein
LNPIIVDFYKNGTLYLKNQIDGLIAVIAEGGKRMRCIGYVAMARRLLIDL